MEVSLCCNSIVLVIHVLTFLTFRKIPTAKIETEFWSEVKTPSEGLKLNQDEIEKLFKREGK